MQAGLKIETKGKTISARNEVSLPKPSFRLLLGCGAKNTQLRQIQ